jgi:hypothetical protein
MKPAATACHRCESRLERTGIVVSMSLSGTPPAVVSFVFDVTRACDGGHLPFVHDTPSMKTGIRAVKRLFVIECS